jgi:hypothetical protein
MFDRVVVDSTCEIFEMCHQVEIAIDEEFAALIPPLSSDELRELESSLVEHGGARDPLIVWDRGDDLSPILLDGHNRMAICKRLGLPYTVNAQRFKSRGEAAEWMERNQLGRRNLSCEAYTLLLGRLYNRAKRKVGGRPPTNGSGPERTSEVFAREHGIDKRTVERAGAFQKAAKKLGVERELSAGRIKISAPQLVAAAKAAPDNPTRDQAAEAIRRARSADGRRKPRGPTRPPQSWLLPEEPADCLKAIRFYAKSFAMRCPQSVNALNEMLARLIEENNHGMAVCRHA